MRVLRSAKIGYKAFVRTGRLSSIQSGSQRCPLLSWRWGGLAAKISTPEVNNLDDLTKRERQVAQAVADGLSNREIALRLNISERTVKARLTSVFQKLDVRDRVQLALLLRGGAG